jgi:hypothetical protein
MTNPVDCAQLLDDTRRDYVRLDTLLGTLSEDQLTTPNVNGSWSVKDNIAHLSFWHCHLIANLQAVKERRESPDPFPGLNTDEENEIIYQQNKDRSLADAQAELHATYRDVVALVESMSNEELNRPLDWLDGQPVTASIAGNTYGHYQEHIDIIERWLATQTS